MDYTKQLTDPNEIGKAIEECFNNDDHEGVLEMVSIYIDAVRRTLDAIENDSIPYEEYYKNHWGDLPEWALHIKGYRNREGWSQQKLAEKVGTYQSIISAIESGKRVVGRKLAKKLADVFKTDYRIFL